MDPPPTQRSHERTYEYRVTLQNSTFHALNMGERLCLDKV